MIAPLADTLLHNLVARRQAEERFINEFLARHGTPSQRERYAEGLLPGAELVDAMRDVAFAAASHLEVFRRITVEEIEATGETIAPQFRTLDAESLSESQWFILKMIRERLPEARVLAKIHEARGRKRWGIVSRCGALAVIQFGPFELRKEFAL